MIIEGNGIITRILAHKEHYLIVSIFAREHGKVKGLLRKTKVKYGSELMVGNWGALRISARLPEHLGRLQFEVTDNLFSRILGTNRVELLNYIVSQLDRNMHEGIAHAKLYDFIEANLPTLLQREDPFEALACLFEFELLLMSELGFAINLQECAITGVREQQDLYYISPRTGAACVREAGEAYHDKLFVIPDFFQGKKLVAEQVLAVNRIIGHFLRKNEIISEDLSKLRTRCIGYLVGTA